MKRILFSIVLLLIALNVNSQILKPVKWSYASKKTGEAQVTLYLKATIEKGWHIYSQFGQDGGPVKTSFHFTPTKDYQLVGRTIEPKPVTVFERNFEMNVSYFENSVIFQQKIKLNKKGGFKIHGNVEFMTCDDEKCLPPEEIPFSISVQ